MQAEEGDGHATRVSPVVQESTRRLNTWAIKALDEQLMVWLTHMLIIASPEDTMTMYFCT